MTAMMPGEPDQDDNAMGDEPELESGAGYGNHARDADEETAPKPDR